MTFIGLLVPREWVHVCSHEKNVLSKEVHFEHGKCFVCDFQLSPFHASTFTFDLPGKSFYPVQIRCRQQKKTAARFPQLDLRGPPAVSVS